MTPTIDNYYSAEVQAEYITNSKLKRFFGTPAIPGCEARAMAEIRKEWKEDITDPLLIGRYVESYFEGTTEQFKKEIVQYNGEQKTINELLYKKDGSLYAKFEHANKVIQTGLHDELFQKYLSGDQQTILTGTIFGQKFMCRLDRINHEKKTLVDLKVMKDFKKIWVYEDELLNDRRVLMNFIAAYGYLDQLAIYNELIRQNFGEHYLCFIAGLTKEKEPDKEIYFIPQEELNMRLKSDDIGEAHLDAPIEKEVKRYVLLRDKKEQPKRCERCDYCKSTKILTGPIHYNDI